MRGVFKAERTVRTDSANVRSDRHSMRLAGNS